MWFPKNMLNGTCAPGIKCNSCYQAGLKYRVYETLFTVEQGLHMGFRGPHKGM